MPPASPPRSSPATRNSCSLRRSCPVPVPDEAESSGASDDAGAASVAPAPLSGDDDADMADDAVLLEYDAAEQLVQLSLRDVGGGSEGGRCEAPAPDAAAAAAAAGDETASLSLSAAAAGVGDQVEVAKAPPPQQFFANQTVQDVPGL